MSETPQASPPPAISNPARPVWRWVVWLFAAIGLLAAITVLWLVAVLFGWQLDRREQAVVAKAGEERLFVVDAIDPLPATSLVAIRIGLLNDVGKVSSSYGRELRNVLLLDRKTGSSRRLLPDNTREISDLHFLPGEDQGERFAPSAQVGNAPDAKQQRPPRYVFFLLSQPDHRDKGSSLMVGPVAAGDPIATLQGIDRIDHFDMVDDSHVALIARQRGQLHFLVLDLAARKVTEDHPIDIG